MKEFWGETNVKGILKNPLQTVTVARIFSDILWHSCVTTKKKNNNKTEAHGFQAGSRLDL